ncbi:MAG: response regulator [Chloroflexi bacterium]|jgi:DNA-binding response OmpR family regulator|nr:response regulator [Chloroflexota bacterium]
MSAARPLVLVVDDDPAICELVRECLESEGYCVESTPDSAAGLARIHAGGVDLALIDARLPDENGVELCRLIRQQPTGARLPLILFTAMPGDVKGYAAAAGANDLLPKPFDLDQLVACIRRWLPPPNASAS